MNGTLAALLFGWSMAASLPALNQDVLSPFEAFVLTPGLLMAAALAARGLYDGLDRLQRRLYRSACNFSLPRAREEGSQVAEVEGCVVGRSH